LDMLNFVKLTHNGLVLGLGFSILPQNGSSKVVKKDSEIIISLSKSNTSNNELDRKYVR